MSYSNFHQPYTLPSMQSAVPEAWKSNANPKPVDSTLQTVVVNSLSGTAGVGGHLDLAVPLGAQSGIMSQPYLKFTVTTTATAADTFRFKGHQSTCLALIQRYTTSVNGVTIDQINNASDSLQDIYTHASSNDYIKNDGTVTVGANVLITATAGTGVNVNTYCIPLFGALSAPSFPLYLLNGVLNIGIDLNPIARAYALVSGTGITAYSVSNVQLVYDKISPSDAFVQAVKADMSMGKKFVVPYINVQNVQLAESAGSNNLNLGVNFSSCRGVIMSQILTADFTTAANLGLSLVNGLNQFQITLDGRLISAVQYDAVNSPSMCFLEANKALSRGFDAAVSDCCADYTVATNQSASNYLTKSFFAGASTLRCAENLSFAGSPVSVLGISWNVTAATFTANFTVLADMQVLISESGQVELLR